MAGHIKDYRTGWHVRPGRPHLSVYRIGRHDWGVWCDRHKRAHGYFDTRDAARVWVREGAAQRFCDSFGWAL